MESLTNVLSLWERGGIMLLAMLSGVVLFHFAEKVWRFPGSALFTTVLGVSLVVLTAVYFVFMEPLHLNVHPRASLFIMLYLWCVFGMLLLAAKNTRRIKLFIGLVSQAGILYALFALL